METTELKDKTATDVYAVLGTGLATKIMEATGRFEFTKERDGVLIFWDNHWENEHSIRADWSLEKLMQWITQFYSEDFMWQGEQKAQRKMRTALGLD